MLANTSIEVVLRILFLIFSNVDIWFAKKKFELRRYSTTETLPTTQNVELINKREFATVAMDKNVKIFMVYIAALSAPTMQVDLFCLAKIGLLLADKIVSKLLPKY